MRVAKKEWFDAVGGRQASALALYFATTVYSLPLGVGNNIGTLLHYVCRVQQQLQGCSVAGASGVQGAWEHAAHMYPGQAVDGGSTAVFRPGRRCCRGNLFTPKQSRLQTESALSRVSPVAFAAIYVWRMQQEGPPVLNCWSHRSPGTGTQRTRTHPRQLVRGRRSGECSTGHTSQSSLAATSLSWLVHSRGFAWFAGRGSRGCKISIPPHFREQRE